MAEESINIAEAKKHFSELIGQVAYAKKRLLITKRGKPMARLVPVEEPAPHLHDARGWLEDNDPFFQTIAKAQLSALIEKVLAGEDVIIGKAGKPVARLIRYESNRQERRPGALKGKIKIAEDFDMLPEEIAKAFGMEKE